MLFKYNVLQQIKSGLITIAFRRWKKPTVKPGSQLHTAIGILKIDDVAVVSLKDISDGKARQAGFENKETLLHDLRKREGTIYQITFHYAGADPRIDLRKQATLTTQEFQQIYDKLAGLDKRSANGPWVKKTLLLIHKHPGIRAADLAEMAAVEKDWFKINVRKLKNLGLTESLEVGYRISARGESILRKWSA